ncbi:MAG: hypothetical protein HS117_12585 [Verrucomicrobiaceae bacterium]|nr:hypothetical protein [Verrucomicrobiaceae bacterium]
MNRRLNTPGAKADTAPSTARRAAAPGFQRNASMQRRAASRQPRAA